MRDSQPEGPGNPIIVRKYGLLEPLNWGDDCQEHLFLQKKFWNTLVEIERAHRAEYRALLAGDEAVAAIHAQIEELKAEIAGHEAARKEARKLHRARTGPHTQWYDGVIRDLQDRLRELFPVAKERRAQAREKMKEAVEALEPKRREAIKAAYAASGLWWSNYNAVIASYDIARRRARKEGTALNFQRFDGSGRFTCQIQGGMSVGDFCAARDRIASLRLVGNAEFALLCQRPAGLPWPSPDSRRAGRQYGLLTITVYSGKNEDGARMRRTLDFPIILHRPLPEAATLKLLAVSRRRLGPGNFRWSATLTFTVEAQAPRHPSPLVCGINLGWKAVKGGLRVATVFDGQAPPEHVVLPQVLIDKLAYCTDLQSRTARGANEHHVWLLGELAEETIPEAIADIFDWFKRVKTPDAGKFARFVLAWRELAPDFLPELLAEAEGHRKALKRLELENHHLKDKMLRRRLDFYRGTAKSIADKYGRIALDKLDLRRTALLETADGVPTALHRLARRNRTWAAVSELREWIVKQAAKSGAEILEPPIKSTRTCHRCGAGVREGSGTTRTCFSCGSSFDTDANAAANLFRAVQGGRKEHDCFPQAGEYFLEFSTD